MILENAIVDEVRAWPMCNDLSGCFDQHQAGARLTLNEMIGAGWVRSRLDAMRDRMKVALFQSEIGSGLFAFTVDVTGANLPSDFAPWSQTPIRPATRARLRINESVKTQGPRLRSP
jgi:hypothetical protein